MAIKIIHDGKMFGKTMRGTEIPVESTFYARRHEGDPIELFLSTFSRIVSLESPRYTWEHANFVCIDYIPVDLEITVKPIAK